MISWRSNTISSHHQSKNDENYSKTLLLQPTSKNPKIPGRNTLSTHLKQPSSFIDDYEIAHMNSIKSPTQSLSISYLPPSITRIPHTSNSTIVSWISNMSTKRVSHVPYF